MLSINPEHAKTLWDRGVPLSDAQWKFANPSITQQAEAKIRQIENEPERALDGLPALVKEADDDSGYGLLRDIVTTLRPIGFHNDARRNCERDVSRQLQKETLYGIGYLLPRAPTDPPCAIPEDVWTGEIDWENCAVEGGGMKFVQVRIVSNFPDLIETQRSGRTETPTFRGRPGTATLVHDAFEALVEENSIDFQAPMTHAYPVIRNWLITKYPADATRLGNLSDEHIRQTISLEFKKLKKSQKQ